MSLVGKASGLTMNDGQDAGPTEKGSHAPDVANQEMRPAPPGDSPVSSGMAQLACNDGSRNVITTPLPRRKQSPVRNTHRRISAIEHVVLENASVSEHLFRHEVAGADFSHRQCLGGAGYLAKAATHALGPVDLSRPVFFDRNCAEVTPLKADSAGRAEIRVHLRGKTARLDHADIVLDKDRHGLATAGAAIANELIDVLFVHDHVDEAFLLGFSDDVEGLVLGEFSAGAAGDVVLSPPVDLKTCL